MRRAQQVWWAVATAVSTWSHLTEVARTAEWIFHQSVTIRPCAQPIALSKFVEGDEITCFAPYRGQ